MKKIASFTVNHCALLPGVYVSRVDYAGAEPVTTFDIRITRPNEELPMNTGTIHAIEHLGATWLRSREEIAHRVIYFGPMGCRTGFYLILAGAYVSSDIVPLLKEMYADIAAFSEKTIPGATPFECGNYRDMDLEGAKTYASYFRRYVLEHIGQDRLNYPSAGQPQETCRIESASALASPSGRV